MNPVRIFAALKRIVPATRVVLSGVRHRGELAAVELAEAREHLTGSLLLGAGVFALILLAGSAFTFAVAASVWHLENRELWLGLLTLAYLLTAAVLGWRLAVRLRNWQPLAETSRQLHDDIVCIEDLVAKGDQPPA